MKLNDVENVLVQPHQGAVDDLFGECEVDLVQIFKIGNEFGMDLDVFLMEGRVLFQFSDEATDEFFGTGIDVGAVKSCKSKILQLIKCLLYIAHVERAVEAVTLRQLPAAVQYAADRIIRRKFKALCFWFHCSLPPFLRRLFRCDERCGFRSA